MVYISSTKMLFKWEYIRVVPVISLLLFLDSSLTLSNRLHFSHIVLLAILTTNSQTHQKHPYSVIIRYISNILKYMRLLHQRTFLEMNLLIFRDIRNNLFNPLHNQLPPRINKTYKRLEYTIIKHLFLGSTLEQVMILSI